MQVSSSKDKNLVIGDMSFYEVIQEIWELHYNTFNVPVFKCDWVQNNGGVRIDELGYILVDLNRVGHKSDSFILASQVKQVFYVEDPSDVRWSVVLTSPQRDFEDRYNDDEQILRDKKVVRYNEDRAPIGENGAKLKSFLGSVTHYHVPITYTSWKSVPAQLKDTIFTTVEAAFVIDPRSRKNVLQTTGISVCQFKNWLTMKYIMPHKDEPHLLQVPPKTYSFIEQNHWEEFVRSRLFETFQEKRQLQQDRQSKNKYNHRISRKGYANLKEEMNEEVRRRVSELEAQIRSKLSAHGSCSMPIMLEKIEENGKRIKVESLDKPKENEKKGKEVMKMNEPELDVLKERDLIKMPTEKEVVCELTSTLPLALKSILRYAEKVMEKDSSITFSLPADLFGISRKSFVLREDIIDLCNMNEVKTFTLVAYMMYLYSSVLGSKENVHFVFIDLSPISSGNT
ncbi:putative serine/threonine-protein kinase nek2 [Cucumis melo var. makuwa]|uniref:Serine/threonine-protein kinase nek2 n=1 Tax=Cucumis melo var. makuwa TaxID=1194695 RepID=A0A5A7VQR7_CUCMM|nr:putative serine/threonine-protein kinase nek2 [Cucumis melo var. makuwa]